MALNTMVSLHFLPRLNEETDNMGGIDGMFHLINILQMIIPSTVFQKITFDEDKWRNS